MKSCSHCKQLRIEKEFHWRNKAKGSLQPYCKECKKEFDKQNHLKNPTGFNARKQINAERNRHKNRELLAQYLIGKKCLDCHETDPVVFEFDHRGDKKADVSLLLSKTSWKKVLEEIEKCDIRCANCHRRRTAKQQGWYKSENRVTV